MVYIAYLIRKLSDALHKILVGVPVFGKNLTYNWDDLEGVLIIHP